MLLLGETPLRPKIISGSSKNFATVALKIPHNFQNFVTNQKFSIWFLQNLLEVTSYLHKAKVALSVRAPSVRVFFAA